MNKWCAVSILGRILFISSICILLFLGTASASGWDKTYDGTGFDSADSIQQTSDGGYVVAGSTSSSGAGGYDVWVLKLDENGNVIWEKTYGGTGYDSAWSIQQTSDGGYVVAARTQSFGVESYDVWVLKLDGNGDVIWQRTYGGTGLDSADSIQQTSDGGYVVAGISGSSSAYPNNAEDFWVLKLDGNGDVIWQRTYGGSGTDWADSVQQTSDGGYIVAGSKRTANNSEDVWVLKLDGNGDVIWQRTYGGSGRDWADSIQQTSDGGYVMAGSTGSFGAGQLDVWVLKLDENGNVIWEKTYGGTGYDSALSIQQTSDGRYVVAGRTSSFGAGDYDVWVLKFDVNGDVIWQRTYGGSGFDWAESIQQTSDGGYVVAGRKNDFSVEGCDAWVIKLDENGNVPSCSVMGTSDALVSNTHTPVMGPYVIMTDTYVSPQASIASVSNTNAGITEVCHSADISLSPTTYDFGSVTVGNSSLPLIVTIYNIGTADRGGWVCLDNLKQFLSDKLLRFMPLPLSAVV
jgi:predicted secreted protein